MALLLAVTGCVGSRTGDGGSTTGLAEPEPDLRAERRAANIADCPITMKTEAPVAGGLPPLTLTCLGGGSETFLAGLRGPMVINFWAQWCGPCREEGPLLATAQRSFHGRVSFLGINTADPQPGAAIEFAKSVGWTYPQLRDSSGDQLRKPPIQVTGLPLTLLVDRHGRIVARHAGVFTSQAQLDEFISTKLQVAKK